MKKLYYDSAYIRTFEAKVLSVRKEKMDMREFWIRQRFFRREADSRTIRVYSVAFL